MKKPPDPKYLGIPNICFSLVDPTDKRDKKYAKKRISRGFDDSETWSLDSTIAKFVLPRLKRFREIYPQVVKDETNLCGDIDKMIVAFEIIEKNSPPYDKKTSRMVRSGMHLFSQCIHALWW